MRLKLTPDHLTPVIAVQQPVFIDDRKVIANQKKPLDDPKLPKADKPATTAPTSSGVSARAATAVDMITTSALIALRDVEKNGKKGTPPPMVARAMCYVARAMQNVYQQHKGASADRIAKSVAAQVLNALVGQEVMKDPRPKGVHIAQATIEAAAKDGAVNASNPRPLDSDTCRPKWTPTDIAGAAIAPLLPSFGKVKTIVPANDSVRAAAPTFTDKDWLAYFKSIEALTPEQITCANFWADGPGTYTPPGHWNKIAMSCAAVTKCSPAEAANLCEMVNASLHDAGVSCWDTKFTHYGERPFQAAQRLGVPFKPVLGTPPFPGYTSGHATFSGAAGEALGRFFDARGDAKKLRSELLSHAQLAGTRAAIKQASTAVEIFALLAKEAADSRIFGGIHIQQDGDEGVQVGRQIGANVYRAMTCGGAT